MYANALPIESGVVGSVSAPTIALTADPMMKNTRTPSVQSVIFFIRTFPTFFARTCPDSSRAKPGCMKKIRKQTVKIHTLFTPLAIALGSN